MRDGSNPFLGISNQTHEQGISRPADTFFMRAAGDRMKDASIQDGGPFVVDHSPENCKI
jgi:SOS-response transcriptional repressor LexA